MHQTPVMAIDGRWQQQPMLQSTGDSRPNDRMAYMLVEQNEFEYELPRMFEFQKKMNLTSREIILSYYTTDNLHCWKLSIKHIRWQWMYWHHMQLQNCNFSKHSISSFLYKMQKKVVENHPKIYTHEYTSNEHGSVRKAVMIINGETLSWQTIKQCQLWLSARLYTTMYKCTFHPHYNAVIGCRRRYRVITRTAVC